MHRFKPRRDFINSFLDNICVPLWNAAITILPTFFIINGICFYVFALPSVLASWPLFVIELVPAIALAIIFGLWKLGDNEHDLIRDAASKIFDEIINEKYGKLKPLERLNLIPKAPKKQGETESKAHSKEFVQGREAAHHRRTSVSTLGLSREESSSPKSPANITPISMEMSSET